MAQSRRWKWVQSVTGTSNVRSASAELGVSHSTVSRWVQKGMPIQTMMELVVKYQCDPIEASVVWGFLPPEAVPELNYDALTQYVPTQVLAAELHRRVDVYTGLRADSERKTSVGMCCGAHKKRPTRK